MLPSFTFTRATYRIHSPSTKSIEPVSVAKVSLLLFASALLTAAADGQPKAPILTGAWRLIEMKRTGANAETLKNPPGAANIHPNALEPYVRRFRPTPH